MNPITWFEWDRCAMCDEQIDLGASTTITLDDGRVVHDGDCLDETREEES